MTVKKILQVPFDTEGNQMHYPYGCYPDLKEFKDNYEFSTTLKFSYFVRGCSAAYAQFVSVSGMKCTMFLKEFEEVIPYLKNGSITGDFTFCKHGQNFGVKLLKADS